MQAIARRIDPGFDWLQIGGPLTAIDPAEKEVVQQVASDHLFFLNPSDLAPNPDLGNMASWFVREDVEADTRIRTLADFMRLPNIARSLLQGRNVDSPTKALVMANFDRAGHLYSTVAGEVRPFIEAINEYATTILFTIAGEPLPRASSLDYILRLREDRTQGRMAVRIECMHGPPPETPGLFAKGQQWELGAFLQELERSRGEE